MIHPATLQNRVHRPTTDLVRVRVLKLTAYRGQRLSPDDCLVMGRLEAVALVEAGVVILLGDQ